MIYKIAPEIEDYFIEQYEQANFRVVPGHWPEMETKQDVDDWISTMGKFFKALSEKT